MDIVVSFNTLQKFLTHYSYGSKPAELYEPIVYLMSLGGKRLRPLLVLFGYQLFAEDWEEAIPAAVSVEVFHNFTLMHDDIMDKAPLRRNQATVHTKWNENIAILSGDVMLVKAYQMLLEGVEDRFLRAAMQKFNACAAKVCEGQQWDMNYEKQLHISEEKYIEMIRLKTAVLLGFALELGAMLAGASPEQQEKIRLFGEHIGVGFQLKDDLLDVYGDPEKFGKQVGGDIVANKKNFLLVEALQNAQEKDLADLHYWLSVEEFDTRHKVEAVTDIYNRLGVGLVAHERISQYFGKAFQLLDELDAPAHKKAVLGEFARQLIERES